MSAHFRVIKLRHRARDPTQIETHAVFRRRHIQFLAHLNVYMHYVAWTVNRFRPLFHNEHGLWDERGVTNAFC
jgi:hypothetical protein